MTKTIPSHWTTRFALAGLSVCAFTSQLALAAPAQLSSNVLPVVAQSTNLGHSESAQPLTIRLWLHHRDGAAFDALVKDLYNPASPNYAHWLTPAQIAQHAPSAADRELVVNELESHGLTVTQNDPDSLSIQATGSLASVESAFHTQINNFSYRGASFFANSVDAKLSGPAAGLVASVSGLNNIGMRPLLAAKLNPVTGKPVQPRLLDSSAASISQYITSDCFSSPASVELTTNGGLPTGVYFGNRYGVNPLPCGYGAADVQSHYGLNAAYSAGLKGQGQTIVIVDAFGSPTIMRDSNAFASLNGLPPLTSANFQIQYPDGPPRYADPGWAVETSIDVQWAHSVAPLAKIVLLVLPSQDDQDFQYAIEYAARKHLGNVVSNSYGVPEFYHGAIAIHSYNQVIKLAAAAGISVNYASGDGGDYGTGSPGAGGVLVPSDSPYATAVGGTSLNVPNASGGYSDTGWGNNLTLLSYASDSVLNPPARFGPIGGSGGGESVFFAKPAFQSSLPGTGRQLPDISAIADPYTGVAVIFTINGHQYLEVYGGTSVACPIFSGIWALANQRAGHPLGQAAPLIARMPANAITDIVPVTSPANVSGILVTNKGSKYYNPSSLLLPLFGTTQFVSALWDLGGGEYVDLSFGTDSSLKVTPGWDNVTGFGSPNGLNFIEAAATQQ